MMADRAAAANSWTVPVVVEQIPEGGLHRELAPDDATRAALAATGGLEHLHDVRAAFDLSHAGQGRVRVVGRVAARVGQICVVSLDPVESAIDEPVDLIFAPPDQIPDLADDTEDEDAPDPPEPIVDGVIDLGRLAADVLYLAIDPYPRKPGVVFDRPVAGPDPEDHPFAALKGLKPTADSAPKKPKDA